MRSAVAEASMAHSVGVDGSNLRLEHTTNGPGAGTFARLPDGAACYNDVTTMELHTPTWTVRMDADGGMEPSRRGLLDMLRDGDAVL